MSRNIHRVMAVAWLLVSLPLAAAELQPISLPQPQTDGGRPLMQVLKDRKTVREFSTNSLSLQTLANLLWAGFGTNRVDGHRTAPSAMNSQEVDLYVALREGTYIYDAPRHELRPVAADDIRAKTGGQDFARTAPVTLIFVADLPRLTKAKPEERERYAGIDTGYISQNIYLFCASEGLASVVHELDRRQLPALLKLKPDQKIILAQAVGYSK
jgi:SagB-type dehydrogenase family enzyme